MSLTEPTPLAFGDIPPQPATTLVFRPPRRTNTEKAALQVQADGPPPPAYSDADGRSVETINDADTANLTGGGTSTANVGPRPPSVAVLQSTPHVPIPIGSDSPHPPHLPPKAEKQKRGIWTIWAAAFDADNWTILAFFLFVDLPWAIFCTTWIFTTAGLAIGFMVLPFLGIPMGIAFAYSWIMLAKADMAMLKHLYPDEESHATHAYPKTPDLTQYQGEFFPVAVLRIFRETFLSADAWKAAVWLSCVKIILSTLSFTLALLSLCLFLPAMVCCLAGPVFAVIRMCGWVEYAGAWAVMGRRGAVVVVVGTGGQVQVLVPGGGPGTGLGIAAAV
ncbi:hypothetical protein M427DRAFT_62539 [Gonapodya prolifera JEL478]|uniref:Sensor domain-containing protein n=1 Tax=Gonapodya prolifera (strain JEL478) TaxID=1344416 RepID=A0A139A0U5_GONPJ|nr:hypothetical protein M427DRAFT_62539 [Gonapodya prolifera JEL478]|eukprot:KXS10344.1 hypothetical protein M427DRAFT_62539 [Gonapodya prolifera JEL478]